MLADSEAMLAAACQNKSVVSLSKQLNLQAAVASLQLFYN